MGSPASSPPKGEPPRNPHAGAAAAFELKPKDALDETAELFKSVFKGEIVP